MTKLRSLLIPIVAASAASLSAAPFLAIGDSAELFLTGTVGVRFDDNITLSNNKTDDVIFEIAPGFALEFGKNALTSGAFTYTETIARYTDTSSLDSELSNVAFNARYDNQVTKLGFNASFVQLNQNTADIRNPNRGQLSRRDVTTIGGNGEFEISQKSSVEAGINYVDTAYKQNTFVDSEIITVPLKYFFEVTPKVDASVGFRYRSTDQTALSAAGTARDFDDYFYSVGARGDFTPKLSGSFSIGVTDRQGDGGSSETSLGLDSSLNYLLSQKTSFNVALSNDFGNSGQGESQENLSFTVGMRSSLSPQFTLTTNATYRKIDYFTRAADDYYEFTVGGEYVLNEYVTLSGNAAYRDNVSGTGAAGDFTNTVIGFSARVRY